MQTIRHPDRNRAVSHTERMKARRIRQRARTPGFTPIRNAKIESRMQATQALLTMAYQKQHDETGAAMPSGADIQREATRTVARTLPPEPVGTRRSFALTNTA